MPWSDVDALVALNDPLLEPLIRAELSDVGVEIERLVVTLVRPRAQQILARYRRSRGMMTEHDAEDAAAIVDLRVIEKLQRVPLSREDAIQSLEKYVVTLTYNLINDMIRKRFPERTRLKNRLRYVLTSDPRFALWTTPSGMAAGLRSWGETPDVSAEVDLAPASISRRMRGANRPAEALHDIFSVFGRAVDFAALVNFVAEIWHVVDTPAEIAWSGRNATEPATPNRLEMRESVRAIWQEIQQLRPAQRKALLLNLRGDTINVVSLFVLTGIAPFDDVAAALEMAPTDLAKIWNDLPLDDLQIASMLGLSRQQIINLRKAARERLNRRVPHGRT